MFDVFQAFGAGGEKRRRAAAVQDAGARAAALGEREASWSAPVLWRFDGRNRGNVRRGGLPEIFWRGIVPANMIAKNKAEIEVVVKRPRDN